MIRFLLALLLFVPAVQAACTKMTMPTDFATVTNGTRANLKANFTEIETRVEPCMDSVDEIRGRFSGYASSLLMSSLEDLRLKLDSDASATALFLLENSSGDSLFRVKEDSTWRAFGAGAVTKVTASDTVIGAHFKTAGSGYYTATTTFIGPLTSDASDDATLNFSGGGAASSSRGAWVSVRGNEAGGNLILTAGDVGGSSGAVIFRYGSAATEAGRFNNSGEFQVAGLAGTGTRLVTATSTGVQGNATTIAGSYTFSSPPTMDSLISSKFYTEATFTISLVQNSGAATIATGTARYVRVGKSVTLYIPALNGASTHADCLLIGLPSTLSPAQLQQMVAVPQVMNNSNSYNGSANVVGGGGTPYIELGFWTAATAHTSTFTTSGNKGLGTPITIHYTTQ
jgi:hypothetical protein